MLACSRGMGNQMARRRATTNGTIATAPPTTMVNVLPHLRSAVFITGAFCTAWAWDLVFYGASHAWAGENPLQDQISFGENQRGGGGSTSSANPKHLLVLLLQYLFCCLCAALCSDLFCRTPKKWTRAAVTAVEFFPSPVFAGKLMAYLGQFSSLKPVQRAMINLAATLFAACLAHSAMILPAVLPFHAANSGQARLLALRVRLGQIVRDTLGFGLGIAWNVLLIQFMAPPDLSRSNRHQHEVLCWHLVGLAGYLAVVTLIAFRLAAIGQHEQHQHQQLRQSSERSLWNQQLVELASFAAYVVCAFTLVAFLNALLHPGWLGTLESLAILLLLSAAMSSIIANIDFLEDEVSEQASNENEKKGGLHCPCGFFLFMPCVCCYCCCPWIPFLWLLAGSETVGVKEQWFSLIAMVSGLASSVEASGMLTDATDALAASLGICDPKYCYHKWLFVFLQTVVAVLTTAVLIPTIALLDETSPNDQDQDQDQAGSNEGVQRENQPLLPKLRNKFQDMVQSM